MLNSSKIIIATWTFALCRIPRQKLGNYIFKMIHRTSLPISPLSAEKWLQSLEVVLYAAWVTWCSSKNCPKAHTWLTPTIPLSMMVPRWRPSLTQDEEARTSWELRTILLTDSDNTMEREYWSQQSSENITISSKHMLFFSSGNWGWGEHSQILLTNTFFLTKVRLF